MMYVSYGGGTNSTAILIILKNLGVRPDMIGFADTGGEKPHTYDHMKAVDAWCERVGFPTITTVKKRYADGTEGNLYDHCMDRDMLPSLAYGFKKCSQKFKIEPQNRLANNFEPFKKHWKAGKKVTKVIGYDAAEDRRVQNSLPAIRKDKKFRYIYPLHHMGLYREDCVEIIKQEGLPLPGKSACFFCPASRLPEIASLKHNYPDLYRAALDLEGNAELTSVKGLGRRFAWKDAKLPDTFDDDFDDDQDEMPCGCYD